MGAFDVENGKYVKLKKAYVVENGKYVKLKKAYVVEGGKYVKLWSGDGTDIVIALDNVFNFLFFEEYSDSQFTEIEPTSDLTAIGKGFNHWDKHVFTVVSGSTTYLCVVTSENTATLSSAQIYSTHKFCLDEVNDDVWTLLRSETVLGGSSVGQGGIITLRLYCIKEDLSVSYVTIYDHPSTGYDSIEWSYTADGTSVTDGRYTFSHPIACNGKLYFVQEYIYYYSTSGGTNSKYECSLMSIDLSNPDDGATCVKENFLKLSDTGDIRPLSTTTLLNFDGVLIFVSRHCIYKLTLDGTCTLLVENWNYSGAFKVNETDFFVYGGSGTAILYQFKDGVLTQLKTVTFPVSGSYMAVKQGVLFYSYTDGNSNTILAYSLDYGSTWTQNTLSLSDALAEAITSSTIHVVASEFC